MDTLEARRLMAAVSWDGGGGNQDWHNPLNWSTNATPGAGDDVQAPLASITVSRPASVRSMQVHTLSVSAPLTIALPSTVGYLTCTSSISGAGKLTIQHQSLLDRAIINAPLDVAGATQANNCYFNGPLSLGARLEARGANTVNGAFAGNTASPVLYGTLRVIGDANHGDAVFEVASGFTNNGTIELAGETATARATLRVKSGTLVNRGRINTVGFAAAVAAERYLEAQLDNIGFVHVAGSSSLGIYKAGAHHVNRHRIDVTTGGPGGLVVAQPDGGSFTNAVSGVMNVEPGREIVVFAGAFNSQGGGLTGQGTMTFSGSVTANFSANWHNTIGKVVFSNATIEGTGTITHAAQNNPLILHNVVNRVSLINNGRLTWLGMYNAQLGSFANNSGATMTIDTAEGNAIVAFASGFTNAEAGTIQLSGGSGFGKMLYVNAGTLVNDGIIRLDVRSAVMINGDYAQRSRAMLHTSIESAAEGGYGYLNATGAVTLAAGAGLSASFAAAFSGGVSDSFAVVRAATVAGRFGSFNSPTTLGGQRLMISYEPAGAVLHFVPLRGDIDRDGQVGFSDLLITSANFGRMGAAYSDGDANGDGQVGFADLLAVSANFGLASSAVAAATPPAAAEGTRPGSLLQIALPDQLEPLADHDLRRQRRLVHIQRQRRAVRPE